MFAQITNSVFVMHLLEKLIGVFIINSSGLSSRKLRKSAFRFNLCFLRFVVKSQCLFKTPQLKTESWAQL